MCARRIRKSTRTPQAPRVGESIDHLFPQIAREWHPSKNGDFTPSTISKGSSFVAWWRCCDCGHDWRAIVHNRTRGRGCPECGKREKGRKRSQPKKGESLLEQRPDVASLWHPTKNLGLTPADVKPYSNKAVWWQCKRHREHVWRRRVAVSVKFDGSCPRCSHQTSEPEIRIFAELSWLFSGVESRCRIAGLEVDVFVKELNIGVEYDGHHWHASKHAADKRKGRSLAAAGVQLVRVREWPLERVMPVDVVTQTRGEIHKSDMNALVLSIAKIAKGIDRIRVAKYVARPAFVNAALYRKYLAYLPDPFPEHSLAQIHPEIASEFCLTKNYPLTPRNFAAKSNKRVWWRCSHCDRTWSAKINNRVVRGRSGCVKCNLLAARKTRATPKPHESLADLYPAIAAEWHSVRNGDRLPTGVKPGSNVAVWWRCSTCGREWKTSVNTRTSGRGCVACGRIEAARKRRIPQRGKSFADVFPAVCCEWHASRNGDLRPTDVKAWSHALVWWNCSTCGHVWQAQVSSRARGSGCDLCGREKSAAAKRIPLQGRSLADVCREICAEWHPHRNGTLTPLDLKKGSGLRVWWKCAVCGHEYRAAVSARTQKRGGTGCIKCGRQRTLLARTTPATNKSIVATHPHIAAEWHPVKNEHKHPSAYKGGSHAKVWWQCKECGNEWLASINKRVAGRGCPKCGRARTNAGRRRPRPGQSLAELFPELAAEWHLQRNNELTPNEVRKASTYRAWWKCRACGHEWSAKVCKRTRGHGCRLCAIARRRKK